MWYVVVYCVYVYAFNHALYTFFSAARDGASGQCEIPKDSRYPDCPSKVDVSSHVLLKDVDGVVQVSLCPLAPDDSPGCNIRCVVCSSQHTAQGLA